MDFLLGLGQFPKMGNTVNWYMLDEWGNWTTSRLWVAVLKKKKKRKGGSMPGKDENS